MRKFTRFHLVISQYVEQYEKYFLFQSRFLLTYLSKYKGPGPEELLFLDSCLHYILGCPAGPAQFKVLFQGVKNTVENQTKDILIFEILKFWKNTTGTISILQVFVYFFEYLIWALKRQKKFHNCLASKLSQRIKTWIILIFVSERYIPTYK